MRRLKNTAALLLPLILTAASAQMPGAGSAPQNQAPPADNAAMIARSVRLYYSAAANGLTSFDCNVHPDWRRLFETSVKHAAISADDPNVLFLDRVAITLHARFNGQSSLEWTPPAGSPTTANPSSPDMVSIMHKSTEQTLMGFLQFWIPFMNGSFIPGNAPAMQIDDSPTSATLHLKQPDADVTEVVSKTSILERMTIATGGKVVELLPSFHSTEKGLIVDRLVVHIRTGEQQLEKDQQMRVEIDYRDIQGFPIPQELSVEAIGAGTFTATLDNCHVNP